MGHVAEIDGARLRTRAEPPRDHGQDQAGERQASGNTRIERRILRASVRENIGRGKEGCLTGHRAGEAEPRSKPAERHRSPGASSHERRILPHVLSHDVPVPTDWRLFAVDRNLAFGCDIRHSAARAAKRPVWPTKNTQPRVWRQRVKISLGRALRGVRPSTPRDAIFCGQRPSSLDGTASGAPFAQLRPREFRCNQHGNDHQGPNHPIGSSRSTRPFHTIADLLGRIVTKRRKSRGRPSQCPGVNCSPRRRGAG